MPGFLMWVLKTELDLLMLVSNYFTELAILTTYQLYTFLVRSFSICSLLLEPIPHILSSFSLYKHFPTTSFTGWQNQESSQALLREANLCNSEEI